MTIQKQIKCFKYLSLSYIILLSFTAAAQIVLGGFFLWGHLGYSLIVQNNLWVPSTIQISLGPLTFISCWYGWSAINKKKTCQLGMLTGSIIVIICLELFIFGWSIALREQLPTSGEFYVENSFQEFLGNHINANQTNIWNRLQYELKCCGVHGPVNYRQRGVSAIPISCCFRPETPTDSLCSSMYTRGCLDVLSGNARDLLIKTALIAILLGLVQSVGIFCIIQLTVLIKRVPKDEIPTVTLRTKNMQELSPLSTRPAVEVETKSNRSSRTK